MNVPLTPSDLDEDLAELHALRALARERDALRTELAEARAVLTHLEWQYDDRGDVCLSCHNLRREGHAPDCALAAALGKEPPMPTGQKESV